MRAIQAVEPGGPEVLREMTVPDPQPGPGQVLVRPVAVGLNFIDTYRRSGKYPKPLPFPHIPGLEGAGDIVTLGENVTGFAVGDRVAWVRSATGSYAELVIVDAAQALHVPDGLDPVLAAAVGLQGFTAHYLTRSIIPLNRDHTVLLHAAAGGVGLLAAQRVTQAGARLVATVSTPAKAELVESLNLPRTTVIPLATLDNPATELPALIRKMTDGAGVNLVLDGVGKDTFQASLDSLARRGTLALFGAASGPVPPFDLQQLIHGSLFVTRPSLDDYTATRTELETRAADVYGAVAQGTLQVRIGARYPLADAAQAHQALESRHTTGKIILTDEPKR